MKWKDGAEPVAKILLIVGSGMRPTKSSSLSDTAGPTLVKLAATGQLT